MVDWNPKSNGDDYTGPMAKRSEIANRYEEAFRLLQGETMNNRIDNLTGNSYESEKQMYIRYHGFTEAEAEFVLEQQTHIERDDIASRIVSRNAFRLLQEETMKKHYPQFDPKVISAPFPDPSTYEGTTSILFQVMNFFLWNNCPMYNTNYNGIEANVHYIQLHCAGEIEVLVRPNSEPQEILAVFFHPDPK